MPVVTTDTRLPASAAAMMTAWALPPALPPATRRRRTLHIQTLRLTGYARS